MPARVEVDEVVSQVVVNVTMLIKFDGRIDQGYSHPRRDFARLKIVETVKPNGWTPTVLLTMAIQRWGRRGHEYRRDAVIGTGAADFGQIVGEILIAHPVHY